MNLYTPFVVQILLYIISHELNRNYTRAKNNNNFIKLILLILVDFRYHKCKIKNKTISHNIYVIIINCTQIKKYIYIVLPNCHLLMR